MDQYTNCHQCHHRIHKDKMCGCVFCNKCSRHHEGSCDKPNLESPTEIREILQEICVILKNKEKQE